MLTDADVKTVIEDIEYIHDHWGNGATDAELRRGSAILRRLLVEQILSHAWRHKGFEKEPHIVAPNIDDAFDGFDIQKIKTALAGGAKNQGTYIAGICINEGSTAPTPSEEFIEFDFSLSSYLNSSCAIVEGKKISRRELIKYMANVKGGVHLGSSKTRTKEKEVIKRVSKLDGKVKAFNNEGLYFEILSTGQALANSADVQKLIIEHKKII